MTINIPLFQQTLGQIEAHPETWYQAEYRCESGLCFAGWTCQLSGGTWASDPEGALASYLIAEPDDGKGVFSHEGRRIISAENRAMRLLGLDEDQADELFYGRNTLADLRRMVTKLCREAS